MEGNKKKKNKNKRGNHKTNQSKSAEEVAVAEPDHGSNHHGQGRSTGASASDAETEKQKIQEVVVAEPDHGSNHHGQGRSIGASESDAETEKQKIQEEKCVKLQDEIRQLGEEKGLWIQKEANLEEKIRLLQSGLETCIQKEIILEEKLNGLLIENDTSIEKQVILENKVKHIEVIGDSWNQKEMTMKEQIIRFDEVNVDLQKQVMELTESKDNLSQENQHLKESLTALELRIQYLENNASLYASSAVKITEFPEEKNLLYQMDVGHEPMNMLSAQNAVLERVALAQEPPNEKVYDIPIEADRHAVAFEPSPVELDHLKPPFSSSTSSDYASDYGETIKSLERTHEAFDIHNSTEDFDANIQVQQGQMPELDGTRISEDIVSVPLDDIQVQDTVPQAVETTEDLATPLSDAPLIGAPFRLISYFAKYVSGADLVDQNRSKSGI